MIRLDLWLTLPDGEQLHAADLAFGDPDRQGRYASALRYTSHYLADPRAFPLDPAALPLAPSEFSGHQLDLPLMALEDALPDAWGRRLLVLRHGLTNLSGCQQGIPQVVVILRLVRFIGQSQPILDDRLHQPPLLIKRQAEPVVRPREIRL